MRFVKATYHLETKTVEYEASNGTRLLKTAGTLNWRFNNPGNIMALPEASKQKGRIGAGTVYNPKKNTFVIFSSIEVGEREKCALLKRKYRDDTISSMMSQYAPEAAGNDPVTYANFISSESGVAKDKKISDLNDNEFDKVVNAISKKEGGLKPGTEKWVYVTNVTVSDGSRPVADVPFKVTLGSTTYQWKTDSYGKLRTIIHTKQGMTIVIKYTNSAGREDVVYSAIAGDETKNIVLTRNFSQFSAKTLVDNPKTEREKSIRKPIKYIVMSGDSLAKIAARYKTSTDEIAKNNNIKDVSKIFPGQHLTIYGVNTDDPSIYMVSPGDTLAKIAAQNGTTVDELARRNNIADLNKIYPGQPILISNDVEYSSSHPVSATDKQAPKPNLLVGSTSSKVQSVNSNIKVLESVGSKKSDKPIALLPHEQREAPWMQKAMAEAKLWGGLKEDKIGHNFHTLVNSKCKYTLTNTAWCASFVNYCFKETSYKISKGFAGSNSFVGDENFKKISLPIYGCLMVWRRNGKGHVAFVYGRDSISGEIIVLGGNQDDSINFMLESDTTKVLVGYYIPAAYSELNRGGLHVFDVVELNKSININYVRKSKGKNKIAIKDG